MVEKLGDTSVILLVGGEGSRLRPVVGPHAKALAPLSGGPWLGYQLEHLRRVGFRHVILAIGAYGTEIRAFVTASHIRGMRLDIVEDGELRLGTGGAIRKALNAVPGQRACVINGDTLVWGDWAGFGTFHEAVVRTGTILTVAVARRTSKDSGSVTVERRNRVVAVAEKARLRGAWCSAGAYMMERDTPQPRGVGLAFSFEYEWLPALVASGKSVV